MSPYLLEVVAYSYASALEAQLGGADRIELCENSAEGGTTPSLGTIEAVRALPGIKLHVMIRPRGGDFHYTATEFKIMLREIALAKAAGADGVVFGVLTPQAKVDLPRLRELVAAAQGMSTTFHRAFDWVSHPLPALQDIQAAGCDRVLTSGQAPNALAGANLIAQLVAQAQPQFKIMAGGGVNAKNVLELIQKTGVTEIHGSLGTVQPTTMQVRPTGLSLGSAPRWEIDAIPVASRAQVAEVSRLLKSQLQ